jgi:hypothetical protein
MRSCDAPVEVDIDGATVTVTFGHPFDLPDQDPPADAVAYGDATTGFDGAAARCDHNLCDEQYAEAFEVAYRSRYARDLRVADRPRVVAGTGRVAFVVLAG